MALGVDGWRGDGSRSLSEGLHDRSRSSLQGEEENGSCSLYVGRKRIPKGSCNALLFMFRRKETESVKRGKILHFLFAFSQTRKVRLWDDFDLSERTVNAVPINQSC